MARNRHWSFGHQNNKHFRYVRVELRNTWNSPFKSVLWSYALMAAAISLLCSLGFYVPAVVSDSPALTFHNRFFFRKLSRESDNSVREYRSEITKIIQLQVLSCFTSILSDGVFQTCWMLSKNYKFGPGMFIRS